MFIARLACLILTCFFLTHCATSQPPASNQPLAWDARAQTLSNLQKWDIKGVIAVRQQQQAWSANLKWQQQQQNYHITLFGPLGTHTYELNGQPGHVQLATAEGQKFTATSPESLLQQQLGWELPVSSLYYWIRGLPVPSLPSETRFDAFHHLTELKQQGWTIQYLRYTSVNNMDLPNKIFLNNPQLNVKILIHQWQF